MAWNLYNIIYSLIKDNDSGLNFNIKANFEYKIKNSQTIIENIIYLINILTDE